MAIGPTKARRGPLPVLMDDERMLLSRVEERIDQRLYEVVASAPEGVAFSFSLEDVPASLVSPAMREHLKARYMDAGWSRIIFHSAEGNPNFQIQLNV